MENVHNIDYQYNIAIIGGGPAGTHAANCYAAKGKTVVLFEQDRLGGCCVHTGCIPTKLLIQEANSGEFSWKAFKARLEEITTSNEEGLRLTLSSRGVRVINERAKAISAHEIKLPDGELITAEQIVLATGGQPYIPQELVGREKLITTDEFWGLEELPQDITIIGGGTVGVEMASALSGLVDKVRIIESNENILYGYSDRARKVLVDRLSSAGVEIYTGVTVDEVECKTDCILCATGRIPAAVEGDYSRIGDATGSDMTAYAAKAEAERLVEKKDTVAVLPQCTYTNPQIAKVGMYASEAAEAGYNPIEGRVPFYALGMGKIYGQTDGYISVVRDQDTDRLLGAEIVGGDACELIHFFLPYIVSGIACEDMKEIVFAHPTFAEGIRIALDMTYGGSVELPERRRRR